MKTTAPPRGDRGAALLLALLVLLAASAAGLLAFLAAFQEWRAGQGSAGYARAQAAAETGLASVEANWSPGYDTLPRGRSLALAPLALAGGDSARPELFPLTGTLYRVTAEGTHAMAAGQARARLGTWLRIDPPLPEVLASLTVLDTARTALAEIRGTDSVPPGWGGRCAPPGSAVPGLRIPPVTTWTGGCPGCVGTPPVLQDTALSASALDRFGPEDYAGLAVRAVRVVTGTLAGVGPSVAGSPPACLFSDSSNWGEPLGSGPAAACRNFFPVVHAPGDLVLDGGRGQGILLVDGDLTLAGGVAYTGVVVVRGRLIASGLGGRVTGGVLASRVDLGAGSGPLDLQYSSCAVGRVLRAAGRPARLSGWRWTQLY